MLGSSAPASQTKKRVQSCTSFNGKTVNPYWIKFKQLGTNWIKLKKMEQIERIIRYHQFFPTKCAFLWMVFHLVFLCHTKDGLMIPCDFSRLEQPVQPHNPCPACLPGWLVRPGREPQAGWMPFHFLSYQLQLNLNGKNPIGRVANSCTLPDCAWSAGLVQSKNLSSKKPSRWKSLRIERPIGAWETASFYRKLTGQAGDNCPTVITKVFMKDTPIIALNVYQVDFKSSESYWIDILDHKLSTFFTAWTSHLPIP